MIMITKFQRSVLVASCLTSALFILLGLGGEIDFVENTILNMSQEQYDSVKTLLTERDGQSPSDRDIAHWWADHHE